MLKIKDLTVTVENKKIINNLNLTINDSEIHVIMGQNGAGKSTICSSIINDPNYLKENGSIIFNEKDITNLDTSSISKEGIFILNQNPLAIEGVTNLEMLRIALSERNNGNIDIFSLKKELESICENINLDKSFITRNINDGMSGGEKKKNELLHIWVLKPSFIILDELDSGLDVDALKDVCNSINKYYQLYKPSILIITHHINILDYIKPDFVHILNDGSIINTGDINLAYDIEKNGFASTFAMIGNNKNE